ncbi:OLC1v1013465C2 [Oldenlandia corymbosa var. corymbosa]|nr:OLC1v1013465C2 [Oldenlandia corymbosa var. corymbosa]
MKGNTSTDAASEHSPGSPFHHCISSYSRNYIEEESLGRGGGGKVKRCQHKLDEKHYAVKIIPYNEDKEAEALNELKILSTFQHTNVVRYYYSWKEEFVVDSASSDSASSSSSNLAYNRTLYVAMELCQRTLRAAFQENRDFSPEDTERMLKEMAESLKCIHDKNVIHCDIAADNIFLDFGGKAMIGDFGLAEFLKDGKSSIECEARGKVLYHAPELSTEGEKRMVNFTKATDIYALGLVMLELLFPSETYMGTKNLFDEAKKDTFPEKNDKVSELQYDTIQRMLSLNADDRPTALQVLNALS